MIWLRMCMSAKWPFLGSVGPDMTAKKGLKWPCGPQQAVIVRICVSVSCMCPLF